jgi:hypothetical protein
MWPWVPWVVSLAMAIMPSPSAGVPHVVPPTRRQQRSPACFSRPWSVVGVWMARTSRLRICVAPPHSSSNL